MLSDYRSQKGPLELLTLSACETAAGDERAALGLAGVAVRTGVSSAVASLWQVEDNSARDLMTHFYRELKNPTNTKAMALQKAQLKIMNNPKYAHPRYWSHILLISNWL